MAKQARTLVLVWLGLMGLLALTVGATFAPIGAFKPVANLAIAFGKAGLVLWFFMQLRAEHRLVRIVALAAVAWLLILIALTQTDLWSRP